jgi:hypothetical protein
MTAPIPTAVKRAEATIRFFEERGRRVSGVTIKGSEFSIDFEPQPKSDIPDADLVTMSK